MLWSIVQKKAKQSSSNDEEQGMSDVEGDADGHVGAAILDAVNAGTSSSTLSRCVPIGDSDSGMGRGRSTSSSSRSSSSGQSSSTSQARSSSSSSSSRSKRIADDSDSKKPVATKVAKIAANTSSGTVVRESSTSFQSPSVLVSWTVSTHMNSFLFQFMFT